MRFLKLCLLAVYAAPGLGLPLRAPPLLPLGREEAAGSPHALARRQVASRATEADSAGRGQPRRRLWDDPRVQLAAIAAPFAGYGLWRQHVNGRKLDLTIQQNNYLAGWRLLTTLRTSEPFRTCFWDEIRPLLTPEQISALDANKRVVLPADHVNNAMFDCMRRTSVGASVLIPIASAGIVDIGGLKRDLDAADWGAGATNAAGNGDGGENTGAQSFSNAEQLWRATQRSFKLNDGLVGAGAAGITTLFRQGQAPAKGMRAGVVGKRL